MFVSFRRQVIGYYSSRVFFSFLISFSTYADDIYLCYSFDSVDATNQAINADLIVLMGWLEGNKVSLNAPKTEAMIIGGNKKLHKTDTLDNSKPQFRKCSEDVMLVNDVKYLGVQVDP